MNEIIKVKILWNSNNFYHDILLSIDMIPLIKAVETENVEIVRLLLKYPSIDVNAKAIFIFYLLFCFMKCQLYFNRTPLILAIEKKNFEIIQLLLKHENINVNAFAILTIF